MIYTVSHIRISLFFFFFFSSRRRHTRSDRDWSSDVCSSDLEETGCEPIRLYNASRVESFYRHRVDEVALGPVFVAFVDRAAEPRLSAEHDRAEWLVPAAAAARLAWPRERRALGDILSIVGGGDAGLLGDVLRVC